MRTCLCVVFWAWSFPSHVCQKSKEISQIRAHARLLQRNLYHPNSLGDRTSILGYQNILVMKLAGHAGRKISNHTLSRGCSIPPLCCKAGKACAAVPCCERSFSTFFEPRPFREIMTRSYDHMNHMNHIYIFIDIHIICAYFLP